MSCSSGLGENAAKTIERLYDASVDPALWMGMSQTIAQSLNATSAVLKTFDTRNATYLLDMTSNMKVSEHLSDWAAHWHDNDLWVKRSVDFGLSRIVTSDDLVTADEQRTTAFYQEWLPHLDIHHMIGAVFPVANGLTAVLGVHRPHDHISFGAGDREAIALLLPHLQRALQLGQRFADRAMLQDATFAALDTLDRGIILLNDREQIIHMNSIAQHILEGCSGIKYSQSGLTVHEASTRVVLKRAITQALSIAGGKALPAPKPFRIERDGRSPLSFIVTPLRPSALRHNSMRPMAMITLRDPEYPPISIDHLRSLFQLRRSEAIVAAELARGLSADDIAQSCGVGLATVRSHIKQILLKTGAHRQAEAVAILTKSLITSPSQQ